MTDQTPRVLLGDSRPASRALFESLCGEQGWHLLAVESSFQVLRMVRDTSDVALVLLDPALPGSGVSGRDVAKTLKASSQFGALPVLFVLHQGEPVPEGAAVNGSIRIDAAPAAVLAAMREAMGGAASAAPRPEAAPEPAPPAEEPPPRELTAAAAAPALRPMETPAAETAPAARSARVIVADTVATTRAVLDPLFERHGWEMLAVESGFQVLRIVRDTEVDLVLINPTLQASGVSGADIARTIKGAAQFRKLPVLFVLHRGQTPPEGAKVDGAVEIDAWAPARVAAAINTAMGRAADAVDGTAVAQAAPEPPSPGPAVPAAHPGPAVAEAPAAGTVASEQLEQIREELLAEARSAAEEAVRRYAAAAGRSLTEQVAALAGGTIPGAAERLDRHERELAALAQELSAARQSREALSATAADSTAVEDAVRRFLADEGQRLAEQTLAAAARDAVSTLARAEPDRDAVEQIVREYLGGPGRTLVEQAVSDLAREVLPLVVGQAGDRPAPPAPAEALAEQALHEIREQVLAEGRQSLEAVARQLAETEGRAAIERSAREFLAGAGRSAAEQLLATLAREAVPAIAERLVQRELARLPAPAARLDELLAQLSEQLSTEARRGAEAAGRELAAAEGRRALEGAVRQYVTADARALAEELIRAAAREAVPAVAERLIAAEIARLRREYRLP